jgi:hypothetical protein
VTVQYSFSAVYECVQTYKAFFGKISNFLLAHITGVPNFVSD